MKKEKQDRILEVGAKRMGSGNPCILTLYKEKGQLVLASVDKSGRTTLAAGIDNKAAQALGRELVAHSSQDSSGCDGIAVPQKKE